jgi:hypothetical protein
MFNFILQRSHSHSQLQLQFYLGEMIFLSLTMLTVIGTRIRSQYKPTNKSIKNVKNVKFNSQPPTINIFKDEPKIYIQTKDVIIDTHSAIPKRDPNNIEKMDPIGNSIQTIKKLLNFYDIYFIYTDYDEVWWLREYFGNEILTKLRNYPKNDGIIISTQPDDFNRNEFIKFGNGNSWPQIETFLLKKINK